VQLKAIGYHLKCLPIFLGLRHLIEGKYNLWHLIEGKYNLWHPTANPQFALRSDDILETVFFDDILKNASAHGTMHIVHVEQKMWIAPSCKFSGCTSMRHNAVTASKAQLLREVC